MNTSSVPQKQCTKCKRSSPDTYEYYGMRHDKKLSTVCRKCDNERIKNRRKENLDQFTVWSQTSRTRKHGLPATMTLADWGNAVGYFKECCAYCNQKRKLIHEHVVPVAKGGGYTPDNILPACRSCNRSKCNQDVSAWCLKKFGSERGLQILENIQNYFTSIKE